MLKLAFDGIIGFSTKPLKFIGGLGLFSIFVSFLIMIYTIVSFITSSNLVAGWSSIMVAVTFFAGVQLVSIWILSEYIGRIYSESQNRPRYIIEKKINFEE